MEFDQRNGGKKKKKEKKVTIPRPVAGSGSAANGEKDLGLTVSHKPHLNIPRGNGDGDR